MIELFLRRSFLFKLLAVPFFILTILLGLSFYSYYGLNTERVLIHDYHNNTFRAYTDLSKIFENATVNHSGIYKALNWAYMSVEPEKIAEYSNGMIEKLRKISNLYSAAKLSFQSKKERDLYLKLQKQYKQYLDTYIEAMNMIQIDRNLSSMAVESAEENFKTFSGTALKLLSIKRANANETYDNLQKNIDRILTIFSAAAIFSIIISVVIALFFGNLLSRQLTVIIEAGRGVAEKLRGSAHTLNDNTVNIIKSLETQVVAMRDAACTVTELFSTVKNNTEKSISANNKSESSKQEADIGMQSIQELVVSMHMITQSYNSITDLTDVIRQIADKTKVINDIVFETKILSFNASIEAAKAGHHGRGFAVVAEEMAKLAKLSGDSAQSISMILDESLDKTERIIKNSQRTVQDGNANVENCKKVFHSIINNVNIIAQQMSHITNGSRDQEERIKLINDNIAKINHLSQNNFQNLNNAQTLVKELQIQGKNMNSVVGYLIGILRGINLKMNSTSTKQLPAA